VLDRVGIVRESDQRPGHPSPDADFAPPFEAHARIAFNPDVAVVQTPQSDYNPDPIPAQSAGRAELVDDQRFFFDIFNRQGCVGMRFCVGTSFVVRRDRLNEIGGFRARRSRKI